MSKEDRKLYVKIAQEEDRESYSISLGEPKEDSIPEQESQEDLVKPKQLSSESSFAGSFHDFINVMDMYMKFVPMILSAGPIIVSATATRRMKKFASVYGKKREDISRKNCIIYELDMKHARRIREHAKELRAFVRGVEHIPEVMIVGLISSYDFMLSRLLTSVFTQKPEIVLTSNRKISYSELITYTSLDDARKAIIEKEVESIGRESHHAQFEIMESNFGMTLRKDLTMWPRFVELCERRNLLTHTGGIVSQQYLTNCDNSKYDTKGIDVGQRLVVDPNYFRSAVKIVFEIGVKLGYVLWRKFDKSNTIDADLTLNDTCYKLIEDRHYSLAETLLDFGSGVLQVRKGKDRTRRMMVINLANAVRLLGHKDRATAILKAEDWSATDEVFNVCVAAVREDHSNVAKYIVKLGRNGGISAEEYKTWPVFRGLRNDPEIAGSFREVFGEELVTRRIEMTSKSKLN